MNSMSDNLTISFSLSSDTVKVLFDFIAEASGSDVDSRKAQRRMENSKNAIFAGEKPPADVNLMVTRQQAAELLQISTRTIDNLKRNKKMPKPIRIGNAVRWNRAELEAWVDAGCPDCKE